MHGAGGVWRKRGIREEGEGGGREEDGGKRRKRKRGRERRRQAGQGRGAGGLTRGEERKVAERGSGHLQDAFQSCCIRFCAVPEGS